MESRSDKSIKYYTNHTLKPTDTFRFECKQCGKCCIRDNSEEPIVITGPDIFHIARALRISVEEAIEKYCRGSIGPDTKLLVLILDTDYRNRCKLMWNGKCTVHLEKPVVCAIFPLGRMQSAESKDGKDIKFTYFTQPEPCKEGAKTKKEITLEDWLNAFNIHARDEESNLWYKLIGILSEVSRRCELPDNVIAHDLGPMLYVYDTEKDLAPQLEERIAFAETLREEMLAFLENEEGETSSEA